MKNQQKYDIIIIGAGVAGAAAALMLKQCMPGYSVAILDNGAVPRRMIESLTPVGGVFLRQLGVWEQFLRENYPPAYGSSASWGTDQIYDHEFLYQTQGNGWHLDRKRFDNFLKKQSLDRGIVIRDGSHYCGHTYSGGSWNVQVIEGGVYRKVSATFVVDASGRKAAFAKREGRKKILLDRMIGVFGFFQTNGIEQVLHNYTLVEACDSGWWFSAMTADNNWVVAWMSDSDLIKKDSMNKHKNFLSKLSTSLHIKDRVKACKLSHALQIFPAASFQLDEPGGVGWVAAGDAVSTLDPLSSGGLVKALQTGIFSAYVALDYFKGIGEKGLHKYNSIVKANYQAYLKTRKKFYKQENRWADSPFWKRRHSGKAESVLI